jgi:LemA protein
LNTHLILEKLYRLPPHRTRRAIISRVFGALRKRFFGWVQRHSSRIGIGSLAVGIWLAAHIYYYNKLIDLEYNVQEAWAQVEAVQQKRNHVQRSLTQLVRYYASYERNVMKEVTTLRTNAKPVEDVSITQLLARLDAVAEQYPNLNLASGVQQFSQSVVAYEADIAERTMQYNTAVNVYTTLLGQFPGNVFGPVLGFHSYPFYKPKDPSILDYGEVQP